MPGTIRKRLIVSGNVQDVAYRAFVKFNARRLGLAGFAKNLDDGTVEVVCEGDERAIREFLKKIDRKGNPESFIDINVVSITETPAPGGPLKPFDIDYGVELTPAERSTKDREELAVYGASQITHGLSQVGRDVKEVGSAVRDVGQAVHGMRSDMNTRFDHMAQRYDLIGTSLVKAIDRMDAGFERMDKNSKRTDRAIEQSRKEAAASNRELAKAVNFMIRKLSDKPARKRPAGKRKR